MINVLVCDKNSVQRRKLCRRQLRHLPAVWFKEKAIPEGVRKRRLQIAFCPLDMRSKIWVDTNRRSRCLKQNTGMTQPGQAIFLSFQQALGNDLVRLVDLFDQLKLAQSLNHW